MDTMSQFLRTSISTKFYKKLLSSTLLSTLTVLTVLAQGTTNLFTIPNSLLSGTFAGSGNFNAIIFGNLDAGRGDTEGRLAVGGNFAFNAIGYGYSVGLSGPDVGSVDAPDNTDNFVVNGNFNNVANNWQVRGNFIYNTATDGISMPSHAAPGQSYGGIANHILFSSLLTRYKTLSTNLKDFVSDGAVSQEANWAPIKLKGIKLVNIFTLTIPDGHNSGFDVEIPEGSTAIVNVTNSTVNIAGGNMTVSTVGIPTYGAGAKVLFNFPNATQISMASFGMLGSFLAPYADFSGNGGSINGQTVIGGNVSQMEGFEFHNFSFTGNFETSLPVTLLDFKAIPETGAVTLAWTTTSESNSSHFDVQRSANGKIWNTIGTVAANGESQELKRYDFTDLTPVKGINLYRLKMTDRDETFTYSRIQSVKMETGASVSIFPNPVSDRILFNNIEEVKQVAISDLSGRRVFQSSQISASGIDCKNFAAGVYVVTMNGANGVIGSQKILVSR
jgi:choice-of-anchor A domain-containing protein